MKNQNVLFLIAVKYLKAYYELEVEMYKTKNETDVYTRRLLDLVADTIQCIS
jgi:hypothetical protein